jgi:hypothetical protein
MPLRAYSISAVHPAAPDTVTFPVSDSPVDSAAEKEASRKEEIKTIATRSGRSVLTLRKRIYPGFPFTADGSRLSRIYPIALLAGRPLSGPWAALYSRQKNCLSRPCARQTFRRSWANFHESQLAIIGQNCMWINESVKVDEAPG